MNNIAFLSAVSGRLTETNGTWRREYVTTPLIRSMGNYHKISGL